MDEYINKHEPIEEIKRIYCTSCNSYNGAMCRACEHQDDIDIIEDTKAADVQPVDRWISVEDRLPDKFEYVLCYCKTTTGEGNEFMFGAYHNDTWWLKTCRTYATLEQPQMRVLYWMPLPEPPKDGDAK